MYVNRHDLSGKAVLETIHYLDIFLQVAAKEEPSTSTAHKKRGRPPKRKRVVFNFNKKKNDAKKEKEESVMEMVKSGTF